MNLNELNIKNIEFDLQNGFFWVEFEGTDRSLQCCLMERKDGKGFRKAIDSIDCAYDWGINGDVNKWAADAEGELGDVHKYLMKQARKIGLKVYSF